MLDKIWKDPVWSKVIATGFLAIVVSIGTYISGSWPTIKAWIEYLWSYAILSTPVPNWLLGMISVPCFLFVYAILIEFKDKLTKQDIEKSFKNYTKDDFFGLRWGWLYYGNQIDNLHSLCPKCEYQIIPKNVSSYSVVPRYEYTCDDCGYSIGTIDGHPNEFNQKAELKIQKALRTGQWAEK